MTKGQDIANHCIFSLSSPGAPMTVTRGGATVGPDAAADAEMLDVQEEEPNAPEYTFQRSLSSQSDQMMMLTRIKD